jgi:hypothetical protein
MRMILVAFNWKGENIEKWFNSDLIFKDIKGEDDLWGGFIHRGVEYQFQIHWESGYITIFLKDGVEIIDRVKGFNVGF